jgi:hypothetical protein
MAATISAAAAAMRTLWSLPPGIRRIRVLLGDV